jgi:hypothetical protein
VSAHRGVPGHLPSPSVVSPLIELKFTRRNAELVRLRLKRSTIRRLAHGRIGAEFLLDGERYRIMAIVELPLYRAAEDFFFLEGETSPSAFLADWAGCYGIRVEDLDVYQTVHVHVFLPVLPGHEAFGVTS